MRSTDERRHLVVLLPALNEEEHIGGLVSEIMRLPLEGVRITALVVDDGSRDRTAEVARAAGAVVVAHPRNRGVGAAFRTGRDWALENGADFLVHMDSDGQVAPREIPLLLAPVRAGEVDLCSGSRFQKGAPAGLSTWKAFGLANVARTVGVLTGYALTDLSCGFRCMSRQVLAIVNPTYDYDYIQETLIQALAAGARVREVPVTVSYDAGDAGMSSRTMRYMSRFFGLTGFALARFYRTRARRLLGLD
jgi:glycosyltransferase involved in cell wall biosynthesis